MRCLVLTCGLLHACDPAEPVTPTSQPAATSPQPAAALPPTQAPPAEPPRAEPDAPTKTPPAPPSSSPPPAPLAIVDRPIRFDAARQAQTIAYRQRHQDPEADSILIEPRMIILHHTGGGSLDAAWRYFDRPVIERGRKTLAAAGDLNVSAHFLVDRDGTIVRLMPENWMARHCIGLNHVAIGVENIGDGRRWPLTPAQVTANIDLVRDLTTRFPSITHVIGHHEYLAFADDPLFVEAEANYRTRKRDPGPEFMAQVRAGLADLELRGPPQAPQPRQ